MRRWMRAAAALTVFVLSILAVGQPGIELMAAEHAGQPGSMQSAGQPGNAGSEAAEKPESEMTEEEKAAKAAKEAREREIQAAYELPVQTNKLKGWPEGPGTYGDAAIVMDAGSGAILYAKNIDKREYPASITKVLTALLAFQYGDMESPVTVSPEALSCLGSGYASIGLKAGNVISMEQTVYAMLLASANEAAYAVGETVAAGQGQGYDWFLAKMNETCAALGGVNSNFANTNGVFDENHYTCARDMALIGSALFDYPMFLRVCQTQQYTIPESDTVEEHVFQQKHHMLLSQNEDYYEYAVGGKTGYTTEAENTLITLADNGERRLVCVVLRTYEGHTYSDTRALLEYGFGNFRKVSIVGHDEDREYSRISDGAYVTLPENVPFEKLERQVEPLEGGTDEAVVTYFYKDMPVGVCEVTLSENYYNKVKQEEEGLKGKAEEKGAKAEEEKNGKAERYKAAVAIGAAMALMISAVIAVAVTRVARMRKEKRRRKTP